MVRWPDPGSRLPLSIPSSTAAPGISGGRMRDQPAAAILSRSQTSGGSDPMGGVVMLDATETLVDLRVPPGNRLEALHGDRTGQQRIRITQQWRIASPDRLRTRQRRDVDYH